jgi:hypothetical protein
MEENGFFSSNISNQKTFAVRKKLNHVYLEYFGAENRGEPQKKNHLERVGMGD